MNQLTAKQLLIEHCVVSLYIAQSISRPFTCYLLRMAVLDLVGRAAVKKDYADLFDGFPPSMTEAAAQEQAPASS